MEDKFILTTQGKFKEQKRWILYYTCLEWEGPEPWFNNLDEVCGFLISGSSFMAVECRVSTSSPIFFGHAKAELLKKYPVKYWTVNSLNHDTYNIKAPNIEDAIALARKKYPGITITGAIQHAVAAVEDLL